MGRPDYKGRKSPIAVKGQLNSDKSGFGYEKYLVRATQPKEQIVQDNEFQIETSNRFSPLEEQNEKTVIPLLRPPKGRER